MIIEKSSDGTYRYSGFSADVCRYLSEVFKFTYVVYYIEIVIMQAFTLKC